jgi:uncharacterized membrane protein YgaE (UPF0421/DUF939 family)
LLANPFFLAIKAGLATLLALVLSELVGNTDHVSAAFIAVLCTSPTVLIGLRRALTQFAGSLVGGLLGVICIALDVPIWIGVPVAVALSIRGAFLLGVSQGHQVAAFSAILVQLLPRGTALETLDTRLVAVFVAAVSGSVVNLVVSGMTYDEIFGRRMRLVEQQVYRLMPGAARNGPEAAQEGFTVIAQLQDELSLALEELRWRQNWEKFRLIQSMWWRVGRLRHLLHVASEMGYLARTTSVTDDELRPFLSWMTHLEGERPRVPDHLEPTAHRIVAELLSLVAGIDHGAADEAGDAVDESTSR